MEKEKSEIERVIKKTKLREIRKKWDRREREKIR